ncbi:MAG TPA: nucleotide exchange factor GrpE [Acidimicrobiaceae bacterium]|nr:nucleotide exchange factor GrpE [Acidimicrobiaceae bacterium]
MGESSEKHLSDEEADGTVEKAQEELKMESARQPQREPSATDETEVDEVGDKSDETASEEASGGELESALAEVDKLRDAALRAEAEMQNMQRRTARDVENAHKFGVERFLQSLLPVVDSLEKAIESAEQASGGAEDAIAEGVVLCHKLLLDVLNKENIEVIDPIGEPFDPNEHQAMSMVENPDMEPNSVFAVVQKGYKLNGRLVRAAMVMVSKAPASQVDDAEEPAADS